MKHFSSFDSTIVWNARITLLEAGLVVQLVRNGNNIDEYITGCFERLFLHFVMAHNMDVLYMIHQGGSKLGVNKSN